MNSRSSPINRGKESFWPVLITAAIAALGGLLFGYDTSVISGAMLFFRHTFQLRTGQLEFAVSVALLGAMLGAVVAGYCSDRWGRRWVMMAVGAGFAVFSLWCGLAGGIVSFEIARLGVGICIGVSSLVAPLYISEMAPARIRGALVSLNQLAITIGIGVAYLVDYALAPTGNWRMMFASAAFPALVLLIGLMFLPESPRWLAGKSRLQQARVAFRRLGHRVDVESELHAIELAVRNESGRFRELLQPSFRRPLWIGLGICILAQITGINTIIYYAPTVLQRAGYPGAQSAILATSFVGATNILVTLVAIAVVDRLGRRPLLIIGSLGMGLAMAYIGWAFARHWHGMPVFYGVIAYLVFFGLSLGPVPWLIIAEIYPTRVRGQGMALATLALWAADWLVSITFLSLLDHLGSPRTFWLFGGLCFVCLLFVFLCVPETKGRTLEEIQQGWQRKAMAETGNTP